MSQQCRHYLISGIVQGVWFRASTRDEANKLQLTGYAKNLADGRVEVIACGAEAQLELLEHWLWQGPPRAKVTAVESHPIDWQEFTQFTTG